MLITSLPRFRLSQMAAVGITENVKGDNKKFEIWYNAREEVYIIQVGAACFCFSAKVLRCELNLLRITDEKHLMRIGV